MAFWMSPRRTRRTPRQKPVRCDDPQLQDLDGVAKRLMDVVAVDELEDRRACNERLEARLEDPL